MLPSKNRISRKDFPAHNMQGFRVFSPLFTAVFYKGSDKNSRPGRESADSESRASVVVSKKTAKSAVLRNTIRRRFYDLLAPFFKEATTTTTIVIYPKVDAKKAEFSVLKTEIERAFKQAKLIK